MEDDFLMVGRPLDAAAGESIRHPLALQTIAAIKDNGDYGLLECRLLSEAGVTADLLIVDVETDGIPNKNKMGINYRERLALAFFDARTQLPEAWPLRKSFPETIHQNHVPPGFPPSICLYEQAAAAVFRTWTPPGFLRRIQWWLKHAARDELHGDGQAPEQFFFVSPMDLVLPPDFEDKLGNDEYKLSLDFGVKRTESRWTIMSSMCKRAAPSTKNHIGLHLIAIHLDPLIHGQVEREPWTLGELEERLRSRGGSIVGTVSDQIKNFVGTGRKQDSGIKGILLIITIPLKIEGGEVGRTQTRAFMLDIDPLTLGVKLGTLVELQGTYIYDHMGAKGPDAVGAWRDTVLEPIEVTSSLTPERARAYAGLDNAGPAGLLLGVGALGSTMLDFWSRSGWGLWTLVDNDYLKPHNYVRHAAIPARVGHYKVNAMAEMDALVYGLEHPRFVAVASDVWRMDIEALKKLGPTDLIVDATTTLEVPRRLSSMDGLQRCVTVFVTPNGRDGVMLAEDSARTIRLDALECQYYRAILHSSWGSHHVADATPKIRSGAGCRDVSLTMPYSVVAGHASVFAEQIQILHSSEAPRVAVWRRDQDSGQTQRFDVELHAPILQEDKELDLSLLWDEGLRKRLYELRAKSLPSETGGVLLGYHDLSEGRIYVIDVLEAPADSRGTQASFERGIQGLSKAVDDVLRLTGKVVGYLGEWHSHPRGYRSDPSRDDIWQALYLGDVLRQDGLPGIMLIVGESDVTFLVAHSK